MMQEECNALQIGPRLRQSMQQMTDKEQQVLRDCLSLGSAIGRMSVQEIAARSGVSPAMVVKVAQRCGYSGYKDLKNALVQYASVPGFDLHQELNPQDDARTVTEKVFKTAINSLQETLAIVDVSALECAAQAIRTAKSIDFYGVGGSGAMAYDAYHKFIRIGIRANCITDSYMMAMSATMLQPGCVAAGFSHSGRSFAVIQAFRLAKQQGATTIAFTNSPQSPLMEYTDIKLCSVARGSPITGENAAARIVQLNILDALFVLVAQGSYEASLANLDRTIKSVASLRA